MTIQKLIALIEQWAIDRELDKYGTVEGQLIKTAEEVAELIIAISKDDVEAIKDAVGDVFVTLVVGNMLYQQFNFNDVYEKTLLDPDHLKQKTFFKGATITKDDWVSEDLKPLSYKNKLITRIQMDSVIISEAFYRQYAVEYMVAQLVRVTEYKGLSMRDCIESAYNEIAGRKGKIVDGSFVKESELD